MYRAVFLHGVSEFVRGKIVYSRLRNRNFSVSHPNENFIADRNFGCAIIRHGDFISAKRKFTRCGFCFHSKRIFARFVKQVRSKAFVVFHRKIFAFDFHHADIQIFYERLVFTNDLHRRYIRFEIVIKSAGNCDVLRRTHDLRRVFINYAYAESKKFRIVVPLSRNGIIVIPVLSWSKTEVLIQFDGVVPRTFRRYDFRRYALRQYHF